MIVPAEVRHLYDRRAPFYDTLVWALSLGRDGTYRDRAVLALDPRPGDRILDVGCGSGLNFSRLPGPTGVDSSAGLLRIARRRGPRLARACAGSLPFSDRSFDRLLCTYVITTVPQWRLALGEMARVLRPGGRLVLTDDRLPPGWFLGPGPMFRRFLRGGWVNLHRDITAAMEADFTEARMEHLHFGMIYLIAATRR